MRKITINTEAAKDGLILLCSEEVAFPFRKMDIVHPLNRDEFIKLVSTLDSWLSEDKINDPLKNMFKDFGG